MGSGNAGLPVGFCPPWTVNAEGRLDSLWPQSVHCDKWVLTIDWNVSGSG